MKPLALLLAASVTAHAYPLDAFPRTGIRRLEGYRLSLERKAAGVRPIPPGGRLPEARIQLRLLSREINLGPKDPFLQQGLERIFAARDPSYGAALLDITDPANPRYAAVREGFRQLPGSVGKILVASAFFDALARARPTPAVRERFLRETSVSAGDVILTDSKTVPFYTPGDPAVLNRALRPGDRFNLWEWLDHMLSQSSNAAASQLWKETLLLHRFGAEYPLPPQREAAFFRETPKTEIARLSLEAMQAPFAAASLDPAQLRQATPFTRRAAALIPGASSYATPLSLLQWLIRLEQGRLTDPWSSLEIKKLLYFARARYRYASAPALDRAAVFFKSGSFFQCSPEPGFQCRQYRGNATNIMNSVAIVESGGRVYLVALMSNVLKINSAGEHMAIAAAIERLVAAAHNPVQPAN